MSQTDALVTKEEKIFRVVYSPDKGSVAEVRSASHWCEQCVVFVDAMKRKLKNYATYDGNVESLKKASASGCLMCGMVLDRCAPDQAEFYITLTGKEDGALCMRVRDPSSYQDRSLMFKRQHFGQAPPGQVAPRVEQGTDSTWHNMLARNWLSVCQNWHQRCNLRFATTFLPSRLLCLRFSNDQVLVRLWNRIGSADAPMAEISLGYCTLSHCWGQMQPLKLTRKSHESFEENIPFDILPKTFADAVRITLNLGISHLWIDSLCICQDDQDDWLAESARMGDIYANGVCNIAALDHGGCFFEGPTPASEALYFSTRGKHYLTTKFSEPAAYDDRLKNSPLAKRGWVFQEIVLSPRTILYGAGGISWDCVEETADEAESMQRRLPYSQAAPAQKSMFAHFQSTATVPYQYPERSAYNKLWQEVVSEYTDTVLTYESDRWLAISGLARRYMEKSGRRLVAGLHWDQLIEELAWWSASPAGRISNGAPTWSWLSCRSRVGMSAVRPNEMLATIVTLPDEQMVTRTWHTIYDSSSPTSSTTQANRFPIRISCHVRPFRYTAQDGRFNESFDADFQIYSMEAETKRIWMDVPLEDDTTVWGVPHSWSLPNDPRLSIILFVPADRDQDCWRRVGVCGALAYGCRWDSPRDRERFLHAFGPVKEVTVI